MKYIECIGVRTKLNRLRAIMGWLKEDRKYLVVLKYLTKE